VRQQHITLEVK